LVGTSKCANTAHYLARRAAGEGQEQNSFRRDAALEEDFDPGRERGRLPSSRSRDDSEGPVPKGGGFSLSRVEFSLRSEHMFDSIVGVLQRLRPRALLAPFTFPEYRHAVEQSLKSDVPSAAIANEADIHKEALRASHTADARRRLLAPAEQRRSLLLALLIGTALVMRAN